MARTSKVVTGLIPAKFSFFLIFFSIASQQKVFNRQRHTWTGSKFVTQEYSTDGILFRGFIMIGSKREALIEANYKVI